MMLFDRIAHFAHSDPHSTALTSSGHRLSYHALWQQIIELADRLQQAGIARLARAR